MLSVQHNVPLAGYTTFGIGGSADYFVIASSQEEIQEAVTFAKEKGIPFFILGKGANILVGDKGFRGMVIKNEAKTANISGNTLYAESGAIIADLIELTCEKGLSGLEHFAGIPSSVGGALWQNLHFLNPQRTETVYIGGILEKAEILKTDKEPLTSETVGNTYFHFSYDFSSLHESRDVVLSATFVLTPKPKEEIQQTIAANLLWRSQKHPEHAENNSAGSVFKKIDKYGAGRLIEQVGLKGKQIGGAKISEKHANFIVNTGTASAQDVRELIALAQTTVKKELDLTLVPEISFIGEF